MTEIDYKALSRGISNDMSPEAIDRRLEIASQLWKAVNELGASTYLGKVSESTPPLKTSTDVSHSPSCIREVGPGQ